MASSSYNFVFKVNGQLFIQQSIICLINMQSIIPKWCKYEKEKSEIETVNEIRNDFWKNAYSFFVVYFERANIHGFSYFGMRYLTFIEK